MKKCSKCEIEKPFSEFGKRLKAKNGLRSNCKSCEKEYCESNKERISERTKQYREDNKEKRKQYLKKNKEKISKQRKEYYENNKEKILKLCKKYREENKYKIKQRDYKYKKQRLLTDNIFKFRCNVRTLIKNSFKRGSNQFKKSTKSEQILGCTIEEFRSYIESKFTEGMSFENHGEWHLDHIIPIAIANTEEEIIKLNHYTNFQPLWAEENIRKGARLDY